RGPPLPALLQIAKRPRATSLPSDRRVVHVGRADLTVLVRHHLSGLRARPRLPARGPQALEQQARNERPVRLAHDPVPYPPHLGLATSGGEDGQPHAIGGQVLACFRVVHWEPVMLLGYRPTSFCDLINVTRRTEEGHANRAI